MNASSPMNDDEVLARVRASLTTARDVLGGVHLKRPVEEIVARGRARARRALAVRAAVAGGTAAVTAAAVVAGMAGASKPPAATAPAAVQAHTVAYVIQRVEEALAEKNMVIQTEIFNAPFPAIMQWSYGERFAEMQSGFMPPAAVKELPWAQGQESWGAGTATINGKLTYVQVDYRRHEWYVTPAQGFQPDCSTNLEFVEYGSGPVNWAAYIQQMLSCGVFTIAGHARVNGQETITITGSMTQPDFWFGTPRVAGNGRGALQVHATLYVDPATYLPVQVIFRNWSQAVVGRPLRGTVREDISVLPPTPGNVAKASVPIPAGFRTVPDTSFGGPMFSYFP